MDPNGFDNYYVYALRPKNIESDEPEINNIVDKLKDKNKFIVHNYLSNAIWNQITDIIQ